LYGSERMFTGRYRMTILSTSRCTLRPFTKADAQSLIPILGSEAVMRYSMTGVMDLPTISSTINGWINLYESHGFGPWAVVHQGQLIGYAGLDSRVVEEIEQIQITFRLAQSCWGKGFATELALSIRDYAFTKLQLSKIIAIIDPENKASIRTISKIGMQFEKTIIYGGLSLQVYSMRSNKKL
jgi:ribosomal-protein-alanine N-acetyltransferase